MELHFLNPVISAFIFATATLCMKRGLTEGAGATRTIFISNTIFFLAMAPMWFFRKESIPTDLLWVPLLAGFASFGGVVFQFLALRIGDVSVATPLLGGKVLFVALFSTIILGNQLPVSWWWGAVMAVFGVALLGYSRFPAERKKLSLTILLTCLSIASFALMDILIAGWGKRFGFNALVAIQQSVLMVCSFGLVPFFSAPLRNIPGKSASWIICGAFLMVGQFYLLNWTISEFGQPTLLNILYSTRGVWSVLLVYSVGSLFGNTESKSAAQLFWQRLIGSLILVGAIVLVLTLR